MDPIITPWTVNVWRGAEAEAIVSETFRSEAEARAFASAFSPEAYPECRVIVFPPAPSCPRCGSTTHFRSLHIRRDAWECLECSSWGGPRKAMKAVRQARRRWWARLPRG